MQARATRPTVFRLERLARGRGRLKSPGVAEIAFGSRCHFVARSGSGHQRPASGASGCLRYERWSAFAEGSEREQRSGQVKSDTRP